LKRVAVFVHYDSHNSIQDYVVYYVKELQKVAENIVFVSDCELSETELSKIAPYVVHSIAYHHGEYDFGSYKRGYQWAKENGLLEHCEELIFANDSCYAPLFPFDDMFSQMSPKNVDFWGATANPKGIGIKDGKAVENDEIHVQSYFVVFKPQVFNSDIFNNFINSVKKENTKGEIIANYEVGMTKLLAENGFRWDVYCELSKKITASHIYAYKELITKNKSPFLKRNVILFKVTYLICPIFTRQLIKQNTKYDYELIKSDRKKNITKCNIVFSYLSALRKWFIRIHFKERNICLFGHWIHLGENTHDKLYK